MLYLYQTMNSNKLRNGESDVSAGDVSLKKQVHNNKNQESS